jgi:hypothetical protein
MDEASWERCPYHNYTIVESLLINGNRFHKIGILVHTYPALTLGTA